MQHLIELLSEPPARVAATDTDWVELERLPASTSQDLARVEASIAKHLSGQNGRCAWLRSQAYMRLRLTALYYPWLSETDPLVLYHQGLRVTLHGRVVTLCSHSPTQGCFLQTLEEMAATREEAAREHMGVLSATHEEAAQERVRCLANKMISNGMLGKRPRACQ